MPKSRWIARFVEASVVALALGLFVTVFLQIRIGGWRSVWGAVLHGSLIADLQEWTLCMAPIALASTFCGARRSGGVSPLRSVPWLMGAVIVSTALIVFMQPFK